MFFVSFVCRTAYIVLHNMWYRILCVQCMSYMHNIIHIAVNFEFSIIITVTMNFHIMNCLNVG